MSWYDNALEEYDQWHAAGASWEAFAEVFGLGYHDDGLPLPMWRCVPCDVFEKSDTEVTCWACGGAMTPARTPVLSNASSGPSA